MFTDDRKDIIELLNKVGIKDVQFGDYNKDINGTPILLDLDNTTHPCVSIENEGYKTDYTFHYYRLNDNGCLEIGTEIRTHEDSDGEFFKDYSLSQLEAEILPPLVPAKDYWFIALIKSFLAHFRGFKIKHS